MFSFKGKPYDPTSKSFFDQNSYSGRMLHFMAVTSPLYLDKNTQLTFLRNFFYSNKKAVEYMEKIK